MAPRLRPSVRSGAGNSARALAESCLDLLGLPGRHLDDAVRQPCTEETRRHALREIDIVQHPAEVLVRFSLGMRLGPVRGMLDQGETGGKFPHTHARRVEALPLARAAIEYIEMLANRIIRPSLVGELEMRFDHIAHITQNGGRTLL